MTKTEARKLARKARQYGYFKQSDSRLAVNCPQCRERVVADVSPFSSMSFMAQLDSQVVEHLLHDCEAAA